MSDLISRSKVIDILEKEKSLRCSYDADIVIFSIEKGIRELPTAYDVNGVIEELEVTKGYACYGIKCDECKYTHDCFEGEKSQEMAIDKAIEIVKQGGVRDDVCEWQSASDGEFIQNPHTKRLYSNEPSMQNVYCNTCGKKDKDCR